MTDLQPTCRICGNPARDIHPLIAPGGGGYRSACRVSCGTCGTYDITEMLISTLESFPSSFSAEDRYRLSAITRAASDGGKVLELTSGNVSHLLENAPQPSPLEQIDLVLDHLAAHTPAGGKPVPLDSKTDYPIAYAHGGEGLDFILDGMIKDGLTERSGSSTPPQYRITMAGYRRLEERKAAPGAAGVESLRGNSVRQGTPDRAGLATQGGRDESDVFISHASEDKDDVARPLYEELTNRGFKVWFDEAELELGDSLPAKIDAGLAGCRFGVVILSPHFFAKNWPRKELDGLAAREAGTGEKIILPIWHDVSEEDVRQRSPMLAAKLGISTAKGLASVVREIAKVLQKQRSSSTAAKP